MKNCGEWLQEFNLLYNNLASDKAPGLEPYEISVLLTKAQLSLVKDYFSQSTDPVREGFDGSIRRQADFASLITTVKLEEETDSSLVHLDTRDSTKYYKYPDDAFLVLNEIVEDTTDEVYYSVVPVSYDEYARLMMRPYKYPSEGQAWRLLTNVTADSSSGSGDTDIVGDAEVELIGRFGTGNNIEYRVRYVKRPQPIILENLSDGLTIDGKTAAQTCLLPEHLHDEILARAVDLAKASWSDSVAPQA